MQTRKNKFNNFVVKLRAWHKKSDRQWKIDRFAFWPSAFILTLIALAYFGGRLANHQDFVMQSWFFGGCALGIGIVGVTVGYKRPQYKTLWAIVDLAWVFMTILTMGKVLIPVETYFAKHALTQAESAVLEAQKRLMFSAYAGLDRACDSAGRGSPACDKWRSLERAISIPGISYGDISDKLAPAVRELRLAGAITKDGEIVSQLKELMDSLNDREAIKAKHETSNFLAPYAYIVILSLALGLRAGRTGAELRRNRQDARTKSRIKKDQAIRKMRRKIREGRTAAKMATRLGGAANHPSQ